MVFALHNYAPAILLLTLAITPFEGTCDSYDHHLPLPPHLPKPPHPPQPPHRPKPPHPPHPPKPPHPPQPPHLPKPPPNKSLHFTLFQHQTINKTSYVTVNGVEGTTETTTTPFGTLFVFQDPLTAKANRSSKQLGTAEGTSITSGLDGLSSILVAKLTLRVKDHKGSVSIVGGTYNMKLSDYPVVGGTEDFLFAKGYVTSSPIDVHGPTLVYKITFHLYWPPYPPQAS